MIRKWLPPIIVVVLLAVAAWFLIDSRFSDSSSGSKSAAAQVVDVGTFSTAIDYAPFYVAKHNGWLDEVARRHNVTLRYTDFEALPAINDALAAERIDVLLEADTPAIIQEAAGNDIVSVAPLASLSLQLVVPGNSAIRSVDDLRGKRIGVLLGSGFHYGLVAALDARHIPRDAYTLVNLAPPEARGALAAGNIDAWAVWPPFPQQSQLEGGARVIPLPGGRVTSLVFATQAFHTSNPALVRDMSAAIQRARQFILTSPDEAKAIVSTEARLPRAVVDLAWPTMDYAFEVTQPTIQNVQGQANFLARQGYVSRQINVERDLLRVSR